MNYEKIVRQIRQKMFDFPPELEGKAEKVLQLAKTKMIAAYPVELKPKSVPLKHQDTFKPVPGPFGGRIDEQATLEALIEYLGGRNSIERLFNISKEAREVPKNGLGLYYTKQEVFRIRALNNGFTEKDVDAYLSYADI